MQSALLAAVFLTRDPNRCVLIMQNTSFLLRLSFRLVSFYTTPRLRWYFNRNIVTTNWEYKRMAKDTYVSTLRPVFYGKWT